MINTANAADVASTTDYYRLAFASLADPGEVAQRGRDAGDALGEDPAAAVTVITERVTAQVRAASEDDLVSTPVGGMRLIDYLPTRTLELTVHTCDLAVALGEPIELPDSAARRSLFLLTDLAVATRQAAPLLHSATGRRDLPRGFTLLN